jgi:lambda family phage portal protein
MRMPWSKRAAVEPKAAGGAIVRRSFAAAETTRMLAGWKWDGGFSAQEIRYQLATIRARSRELAKNSTAHKRFLQLFAVNVVGDGFTFKSLPHDGFPGSKDYRLDSQAARFIEYHFWRWCSHRDPETGRTWCDASGRKTMAEMDILNAKTWARDGEYIMYEIAADNPYGIAYRIIRPDALDETYCREPSAGLNPIYCGVEMSLATGRPVAYYFHTTDVSSSIRGYHGQPLVRIPAEKIIHGFEPEDEDQPRGIPLGHASLIKLKMMQLYDEAEITAARDEACSVRTYYSTEADPDGITDLTDEDNADAANALTQDKQAGQSEVLPPGWKSDVNVPQHPNREVTAFKTAMDRDISSGYGIEYSNAYNNWAGVSFSSVRQGTISERDCWILRQNMMISQSKSPVFLAWLKSFLSLAVSGNYPAEKIGKFAEHEFRGKRWMWVDPMKDMNAAKMAVENGWKTNGQVASDLGTDYGDNLEEQKLETEMRKKAGIKDPPPSNGQAQPQDEPEQAPATKMNE